MSELVSILIPVYNRKGIISETLDSALTQSYTNIEVIVVDNASTDGTWDVIQAYAEGDQRIRAFQNKTNVGPVRNWRRAVDEASGVYGKILWSDDLIAPDFIEKTLPHLKEEVAFVYSGARLFSVDPAEGHAAFQEKGEGIYPSADFISRALYDNDVPFSPGCAIFRMADLRENLLVEIPNGVGSDFPAHAIGNDLILFLLSCLRYRWVASVPETLSFFRAHGGSISISAKNGKLPLHYLLAKSYFVDLHYPQERARLAAVVKVMLWKYPDAKQYGMASSCLFFKQPVAVDTLFFMTLIVQEAVKAPGWIVRKLQRLVSVRE